MAFIITEVPVDPQVLAETLDSEYSLTSRDPLELLIEFEEQDCFLCLETFLSDRG